MLVNFEIICEGFNCEKFGSSHRIHIKGVDEEDLTGILVDHVDGKTIMEYIENGIIKIDVNALAKYLVDSDFCVAPYDELELLVPQLKARGHTLTLKQS